jgi:hypothetical protein
MRRTAQIPKGMELNRHDLQPPPPPPETTDGSICYVNIVPRVHVLKNREVLFVNANRIV